LAPLLYRQRQLRSHTHAGHLHRRNRHILVKSPWPRHQREIRDRDADSQYRCMADLNLLGPTVNCSKKQFGPADAISLEE
jgi:hypothetical protein